ncbi:MAG: DUF4397 domain-containing protein [Anaerolineales bacterium]|nr:DUF4397 domain-containing protein [Anaerolineales bacterium]
MKSTSRLLLVTAILLLTGLIWVGFTPSQTATAQKDGPATEGIFRGTMPVVNFDVSPPLRDMTPAEPQFLSGIEIIDDFETGFEGPLGPQDLDPIVQSAVGTGEIPNPLVSFNGPANISGVQPPDPNGDVGPNHVVVMSNLSFQIFDKAGNSLYGPVLNNTLWAGFGGACQTENAGDPVVLHDQFNDRWILSQFTSAGPTWYNCVAISQTADPTGAYYRYAISTGSNFPDYPKYGVWSNAYYISTREFAGGSSFAGVGAYAIEIADVIAGNPTPTVISFLVPPGGAAYNVGDGLLPADIDGATLPPSDVAYFMGSMDDGGPYGAPQDALTLWKFTPDFTTPANSSFVLANTIPITNFDTMFAGCSGRSCIPQPGTTNKIDILSYRQRPIWRLAYRNFGTHESLVTNQSVEATGGIAGNRWWEIRSPGSSPVIYQEGTYAPGTSDGIHRWMGSIAMDGSGNIAFAYSASDATSTFPSVWYTGRLAGDPLGQMTLGEGSIIDGTGSQTSGQRWGDYSSLTVDPVDDCTFWAVNEWLPVSGGNWTLRVGAFKFDECGSPDFTLNVAPASQEVCKPNDALFDVTVGQVQSYTDQVTLSTQGEPGGSSVNFSANPGTPPFTSTLTIGNTGAAAEGTYSIAVVGVAATSTHTSTVELSLFDAISGAPTLLSPADGAVDQPLVPTLTWDAIAEAGTYDLEIATDAGFTNVIYSASGLTDTSAVVGVELDPATTYYWHVRKTNVCGDGAWATAFSFTTVTNPVADIVLTKTVGTVPTLCAVTDVITVTFGTDVTYCYSVENTGDLTLDLHTLTDSELGSLFTGLPYALVPGGTAFVTTTVTINATVVNTATWEAYNPAGYTLDDTAPFNWVDISPTGTALNLTDDSEANVTLPFQFTYYGVTSNLIRVGNNGGILFAATTGDVGITNGTLPDAAHPLGIFPFWDDIDADTGNVYYETQGTAPNRQFIIQWHDRPHFSNSPGHVTFQLVLFETTNEILFNYLDVDFSDPQWNFGASATVGINENGSSALLYSFNTASLSNNLAILIAPETSQYAADTDTATVNVEAIPATIEVNPTSLSSTQENDVIITETLTISNLGNEVLDWMVEEDGGVLVGSSVVPTFPASQPGANGSRGGTSEATTPLQYRSPADFSEGFDDITNLPGWFTQNNSNPLGTSTWFQGNDTVFPAHVGAPTAYIGANFNNTAGVGTISNWLLTPELSLSNGDTFSFWTRTATGSIWPDRLQVRLSTAGASTNVGSGAEDVGDFATVLLDINPTLVAGGYPETWTQYSVVLSGLPNGTTGRLAFRYYVTNGGPSGSNSNYIGIDTVEYVSGGAPNVCSAPSDIPWLNVTPASGSTTGGSSSNVAVAFDSTGLSAGVYTGTLCVTSNDVANPLVTVPVEMTVETDPAQLAVAHLAPFAASAPVTVTIDGTPVLFGFDYGDSTAYLQLPAGDYDVAVYPEGSPTPAITGTISLAPGMDYSSVAVGDGVNQPLGLLLLTDDNAAPTPGTFKLRLGHLAPFASGLALADIRLQDGSPVAVNVPYGAVAPYLELPAGTYDLKITTPGGGTTLIDPLPATFSAGDIVTTFATGEGTNQPLGIFAWPTNVAGGFLPLVEYGVSLSADQSASGDAGTTVSYDVMVTNTGNFTDTFDLTFAGAWGVALSESSVTLAAGASATITVEVDVPADATDGDSAVTTVTATSQGDGTTTDSTDLTTTAVVAGPASYDVFLPLVGKN